MRITLSSQNAFAKYTIGNTFAALARSQEQVATGKRILKPSDDPVGTDQALIYTQAIRDIDQFVRNIALSKDFMMRTEGAISEMNNIIREMESISQQANNAVLTPSARQGLADKLEAIRTRVIDLTNTKHLGRYIFSGHRTDHSPLGYQHTMAGTAAFAATGTAGTLTLNGVSITVDAAETAGSLVDKINTYTFKHGITASEAGGVLTLEMRESSMEPMINLSASGGYTLDDILGAGAAEAIGSTLIYAGDRGNLSMQISPSAMQAPNMHADRMLNLGGAHNPAEPDIFKLLDDLKAAVLSGNPDDLAQQQLHIDEAGKRIMVMYVELGGRMQNLEGVDNYVKATQDSLRELLSKTEDADITQAIVNLKTQEMVYQASLFSASTMFQMSLMDFMR